MNGFSQKLLRYKSKMTMYLSQSLRWLSKKIRSIVDAHPLKRGFSILDFVGTCRGASARRALNTFYPSEQCNVATACRGPF